MIMPIKPTGKEEEYFARIEFERLRKIEEEKQAKLKKEERERLKELHYMKCPKCGMPSKTCCSRTTPISSACSLAMRTTTDA